MPNYMEMPPADASQLAENFAAPVADQAPVMDTQQQMPAPAPTDIQQQAPVAEQAPVAPQPAQPQPQQLMPPQPPTPQARDAEDLAHMKDAATKQVVPQTHASLFADKSTLGKVGTIFGLLLSGAGSGLAHQSNALLDMMNNRIKNDLDAQKSNVTNAQNFLNTSFQHELQQAQIRRSEYENQLTKSQFGVAPAQIAQAEETTKGIKIENKAKALKTQALENALGGTPPSVGGGNAGGLSQPASSPAPLPPPHPEDIKHAAIAAPLRAENAMRIAIYQHLSDASANNPQAQAALENQVKPAVLAANAQNNAKISAIHAISSPEQAALNGDVVTNRALLNQKIALRAMDPSIPGGIDQDTANKEIAALEQNKQLYAQAVDAAKELAGMANHGQVNPILGAGMKGVGGVGSFLAGLVTGGPAGGIAGAGVGNSINEGANTAIEYMERPRTRLTKILKQAGIDADAILPGRADKKEDLGRVWEAMNKAFAIRDAGLGQNLKTLGLKSPFPFQPYVAGERSPPSGGGGEDFSTAGISSKRANDEALTKGMKRMAK